jgi:hypothetical protein
MNGYRMSGGQRPQKGLFPWKRTPACGGVLHYRRVALEKGCAYLDTAKVIASSDIDGVHFEIEAHKKLGRAGAKRVREVLDH